ncbi:MAG: YraN family protein [Pseudanabaena sp. ELA607]|jgi:putative endonuclease
MKAHTNHNAQRHQLGIDGENFVAQLMQQAGWEILSTRWRCRWGEIDVIAADGEWLVFIEVKTRQKYHQHNQQYSLDAQGLLAVDYRKQQKLSLAAQFFLTQFASQFPDKSLPLNHRFDVALVAYLPQTKPNQSPHQLELVEYLPNAFAMITASPD